MDRSRRMRREFLIPFALLAAVTGLGYAFGGEARTSSPSFGFARSIAPMTWWGVLFLLGAAVLTFALTVNWPWLIWRALFVGGCIYLWWGICLAIGIAVAPHASLNAWAVYVFIGFTHFYAAWRAHP